MGQLLLRGMLAGFLAALLAFSFAKIVGEPQVDRAIAFEEQHSAAEHATGAAEDHGHSHAATASGEAEEPELVSREVQAGFGLLTGVAVFGTALGGLFALALGIVSQPAVFTIYGRLSGPLGERAADLAQAVKAVAGIAAG